MLDNEQLASLRERLAGRYGEPWNNNEDGDEDDPDVCPGSDDVHILICRNCDGKTDYSCGGHVYECEKCDQDYHVCQDCGNDRDCDHRWKCQECDVDRQEQGESEDSGHE